MRKVLVFCVATMAMSFSLPSKGYAQSCWLNAPPGTVAACGTAPGYYQPQPYTLSQGGGYVPGPNVYYAPTGPQQRSWYQYYPSSNSYGPREPNPFGQNGRLSPPRTAHHLYHTRVRPWWNTRVRPQYR